MTDSYGCFSAYYVTLADNLPYCQLLIHVRSELLLMNTGKF